MRTSSAFALLALVLALPTAAAHQGIPEPLTGTVEVEPGGVVVVAIDSLHGRDVLNFRLDVQGDGSAVAADVLWKDVAGAAHVTAGAAAARSREFRFDAPPDLASATVALRNTGEAPATVRYEYLSSAPFWRSPDLVFPAVLPFVFLAGAVLVARVLAPWMRRRGAGPVRPPGWNEAQAAKRSARAAHKTGVHNQKEAITE